MIGRKTAALIAASIEAGALLATDDEDVIARYRGFGWALGLAFQLNDDLLGIWGAERATGKEASDVAHRKQTLPVIYAHETAGPEDRARLQALYAAPDRTPAEVAEVVAILERTGAREYTREQARRYRDEALAELDAAGVLGAGRPGAARADHRGRHRRLRATAGAGAAAVSRRAPGTPRSRSPSTRAARRHSSRASRPRVPGTPPLRIVGVRGGPRLDGTRVGGLVHVPLLGRDELDASGPPVRRPRPSAASPAAPSTSSSRAIPNAARPSGSGSATHAPSPNTTVPARADDRGRGTRWSPPGRRRSRSRPSRSPGRRSARRAAPGRVGVDRARAAPATPASSAAARASAMNQRLRSNPSALVPGQRRSRRISSAAFPEPSSTIRAPGASGDPLGERVEPLQRDRPEAGPRPVGDRGEPQRIAGRRQAYRSSSSSPVRSRGSRTTSTLPTRLPSVVSTVSVSPSTWTRSPGFGTPPMRW